MSSSSATVTSIHQELVAAILEPGRVSEWSLAQWDAQVRLSRRLRLLSRLAAAIDSHGLLDSVPPQPRRHLVSALHLSRWRTRSMRWAIERVGASLSGRGYPLVLLKGAAYLSQGLPIAMGRLPSDLDILVPKAALDDALDRLRQDGWQAMSLDDHDQRYYREWSHEAPPMRHPAHRMELDLHHNILPPIGRPSVDAALLFGALQPSPVEGWHVLSAADQFLHAAAHLFCDSVHRDRLRDLVDLDGLARASGAGDSYWADVAARADVLGLQEPLWMAGCILSRLMGTPSAESILSRLSGSVIRRWQRQGLASLLANALTPVDHDIEPGFMAHAVDMILLTRYHLNRMPLRLLIPHLAHKWRVARQTPQAGEGGAPTEGTGAAR
ncbi:MAG: nucleotidyltransferase family protein [Burkholderiaceae bacterium]